MRPKIKTALVLVCATAIAACVADNAMSAGVPEVLKITSQTNTKTNNDKIMFLAKPGEKITFSANANGAEKYVWQVNRKVQDKATTRPSSPQSGDSFTWTVPAEKSNWDITVVVSSLAGRNRVTWSVTTSTIKTVKSGESIQKAIDSLPAEGGIVELSAGTWKITSTIRILGKSNVTLRGAGAEKTVLKTGKDSDMCIIASPLDDNHFILYEKAGGEAQQSPKLKNAPFLTNVNMRDFHMLGPGTRVLKKRMGGILYAKIKGSTISNVTAEKLGEGIWMFRCNENTLNGVRVVRANRGGFFFSVCNDTTIRNCLLESCNRWYALDLQGSKRNKVIDNTFRGNGQGDIKLYSTADHNDIFGNIFDGAGSSNCGVLIMDGRWNLIQGNVFTGHRKVSSYAAVIQRSGGLSRTNHFNHDNRIISNVFYAGRGDAIVCAVGVPPEVRNNIIVKSGGKAIVGIAADKCSYNNLWKNAGGNKGGGAGSISADPLFVNPAKGDFHLKSKTGRWEPKSKKWVIDKVASPCIDAGDPKAKFSNEPSPNGKKINMGAYGNTAEASKSTMKEK